MDEPKPVDPRIDELVQSVTDGYASLLSADAIDCMQTVLHAVYALHPPTEQLVHDIVAPPVVDRSDGIARGGAETESAEDAKKRGGGSGA